MTLPFSVLCWKVTSILWMPYTCKTYSKGKPFSPCGSTSCDMWVCSLRSWCNSLCIHLRKSTRSFTVAVLLPRSLSVLDMNSVKGIFVRSSSPSPCGSVARQRVAHLQVWTQRKAPLSLMMRQSVNSMISESIHKSSNYRNLCQIAPQRAHLQSWSKWWHQHLLHARLVEPVGSLSCAGTRLSQCTHHCWCQLLLAGTLASRLGHAAYISRLLIPSNFIYPVISCNFYSSFADTMSGMCLRQLHREEKPAVDMSFLSAAACLGRGETMSQVLVFLFSCLVFFLL